MTQAVNIFSSVHIKNPTYWKKSVNVRFSEWQSFNVSKWQFIIIIIKAEVQSGMAFQYRPKPFLTTLIEYVACIVIRAVSISLFQFRYDIDIDIK